MASFLGACSFRLAMGGRMKRLLARLELKKKIKRGEATPLEVFRYENNMTDDSFKQFKIQYRQASVKEMVSTEELWALMEHAPLLRKRLIDLLGGKETYHSVLAANDLSFEVLKECVEGSTN